MPLESCPKYEALSYRWGADNDSEKIFVDGLSVKISRTLKRALQEWQSSTETKLVWVDALCIDQANDQERNEQVTKMRNIYSQAANVVVWLGEGTPSSPLAFSLVRDLYGHLNESAYFGDALLDAHRQSHWDALVEIMEREYWQRIWVVQEINSARSLILRCGSDANK